MPNQKSITDRPGFFARLLLRFRWWIAGPVLRPILNEWAATSKNAGAAARMQGAPRDWQIECIARSELYSVTAMEIEQAFGCTSFDESKHYIRHYE
jgi:hypothetical protein